MARSQTKATATKATAIPQNSILASSRDLLKQVPWRTKFERENFLFGALSGPRLIVVLCQDIESLNNQYVQSTQDWEKEKILEEMGIINDKIKELSAELTTDLGTAIEEAESEFWVETLARKSAIEALCNQVSVENMTQMLKLPAELYEESVTKCQSFLNVIGKTTRLAERKANLTGVSSESE
jgi:hypothetical protein